MRTCRVVGGTSRLREYIVRWERVVPPGGESAGRSVLPCRRSIIEDGRGVLSPEGGEGKGRV